MRSQVDFYQILKKKREFFDEKLPLQIVLPTVTLHDKTRDLIEITMDIVMNDKQYIKKGNEYYEYSTLAHLYSDNKRRILYNVFRLLTTSGSTDSETVFRTNLIDEYYRLVNKASNKNSSPYLIPVYKHGYRRIILRMHFDSVANTFREPSTQRRNYFSAIYDYDTANVKNNGLARRLLIILQRNPIVVPRKTDSYGLDALISLSSVMKSLFLNPHYTNDSVADELLRNYAQNNPDDIRSLAEIIHEMRKRTKENKWVPLVILKFSKPGNVHAEDIEAVLLGICSGDIVEKENNSNYYKYGIKITIAGRRFIELMPEFEYFAAKHTRNLLTISRKPLFCYSAIDEMHLGLNLVKYVQSEAFKCIEFMTIYYQQFVDTPGLEPGVHLYRYNSLYNEKLGEEYDVVRYLYRKYDIEQRFYSLTELTDSERIIRSHISYIDDYRLLVVSALIENNDSLSDEIKLALKDTKNESPSIVTKPSNLNGALGNANTMSQEFMKSHPELERNEELKKIVSKSFTISLGLLKAIKEYVEKLVELTDNLFTEHPNSNYREYFIGGHRRSKSEIKSPYKHKKYGYATMLKELSKAVEYPLNISLTILPKR